MSDSFEEKTIHTHLDTIFQTQVNIVEKKVDGIRLYRVEIHCIPTNSEVVIPCPTKRSAEIVCHWFCRGLVHA